MLYVDDLAKLALFMKPTAPIGQDYIFRWIRLYRWVRFYSIQSIYSICLFGSFSYIFSKTELYLVPIFLLSRGADDR